jgi:cytochrome c oxidase assembly protein subunit 15
MASVAELRHLVQKGLPLSLKSNVNQYAPVAKWLFGCGGLVAGIVHVGGVTRLTKSGLSMTDWKLTGGLPPMNEGDWQIEFEKYKQFPEWQQRQSMSLDEFQTIFYWEWGHRMLGRCAGVCFGVPAAYFAAKKMVPPGYGPRLVTLLCMGGGQGLIGWWMVKSGLGEDRRADSKEIRVSPYRLATHLGMAFGTYSLLLWTGLDVASYPSTNRARDAANNALGQVRRNLFQNVDMLNMARRLRGGAIFVTGLTGLTALSGAFVAGNDAGNAYNTFPGMGLNGEWFLPYRDYFDPKVPILRNFFENTALVQLDHRILGVSTAAAAVTLAGVGMLHPMARNVVTPQVTKGLLAVGGIGVAQMSLGIVTLINYVPVSLAAAHQLGSLAMLSSGLFLVHSFRYAARSTALGLRVEAIARDKYHLLHGVASVKPGTVSEMAAVGIRAAREKRFNGAT